MRSICDYAYYEIVEYISCLLTHFVPGKSNQTSPPSPGSDFPVVPVAVGVGVAAVAAVIVVVVVVVVCCYRRRKDNGGQLDTPRAFS